jgi:hypothetical protein
MTILRFRPLAFWLAAAATLFPAEFYTGQAARLVIGQRTFTEQSPGVVVPGASSESLGTNATLLGGVGGLAYANNTLFVADSNRVASAPLNHRVLIYRNIADTVLPVNALVPQAGRCPACRGAADVVLGQADLTKNELKLIPTQSSLRNPTAVASDGVRLAVADTDNNRVLIWNRIPTTNNQPADIVLGQPNFTTGVAPVRGSAPLQRLRGPQGVWIQGNRLFVADSGHNRVLIWNNFPTSNTSAADVVIGQPDFNTVVELDLTLTRIDPKAENLVNPVSVSTDGTRLLVADLGQNRVMIWNSIPTRNGQPADLVLGQPDFVSAIPNNSSKLCEANGKDADGKDTFPVRCASTIEFPRFVLGDGRRLFIADGGNDRILVYNAYPTRNGQPADVILGQVTQTINRSSDSAFPLFRASADILRTPLSMAWDGTNLYVSDTFNRRVLVYSLHDQPLPFTAVRNSASRDVFATGTLTFGGALRENDEVTVKINDKEYKVKVGRDDSQANIVRRLVAVINADSSAVVTATAFPDQQIVLLTARAGGEDGNAITLTVSTTPNDAQIQVTASGATLGGGQDAAKIAPGTVVTLFGDNLSEQTVSVPENAQELPRTLAGVRVYFDGIEAPLFSVSPTSITAQMPWEVIDSSGANAYVRIEKQDGSVVTTSPVAVPIIPQNPGIFALPGTDPRQGIVTHFSDRATGTVSVDGTAKAGDTASVIIEDREYAYVVKEGDDLAKIRDGVIALINAREDEKVEAFAAGLFTRIRLRAKQPGEAGNGILYTARSNDGAQVIMTATTPSLCCANTAGALVTEDNPAQPGETIVVLATGLGQVKEEAARASIKTGRVYDGPEFNEVNEFVSSLAGAKTANVLLSALKPGLIGVYEVHLELNSDLPTNPFTQVTIAQDIYVSNVVTFPLRNPKPPATTP